MIQLLQLGVKKLNESGANNMFKIPYGISNFRMIRDKQDNYLYIDKTHFIHKIEKTKYLMHLRPRRFGKSLFVDMMDNYYDINSADKFDELFSGLHIHQTPTRHRNSYYILRLDFSGIQNTEMENLEQGFLRRVKNDIENFINRYKLNIQLSNTDSPASVLDSLLKDFRASELNHKIYIMIDEYDHFTNSVLSGDGEAFLAVLRRGGYVRSFYEVIKQNVGIGVVERFFITGVMSVTLDSMSSGFNIATNITTHRDFADLMGFTTDEVKDVLSLSFTDGDEEPNAINLTTNEQAEVYDIFRENYNGYLFSEDSETKVFNSTLIMFYFKNYLPDKRIPRNLIDPNLNQTGTTIENIVGLKNSEQNYQIIEQIVGNKQIGGTLQPFINVDVKFDKNDLITLLYNIGMLTIKSFDMETQFEMPNKIIENIYLQYLSDLIQRQSNYTLEVSAQQDAIIEFGRQGKIDTLTNLVSEFLMHSKSALHTAVRNTQNFDEKYIKLAYLMILANSNQFAVYDELPALQGFSDVLIFKAPNSTARFEAIIELKYIKKADATDTKIEVELNDGINQINLYMQDNRLANRENFKKFVVVFVGFEVARFVEL